MMRVVLLCCCLAGCAVWPDGSDEPLVRDTGAWPRLVPASELFATLPEARTDDARALAARASALRARAAILRRSAGSSDEMEALRARLAR